jgi:hypothetical protein
MARAPSVRAGLAIAGAARAFLTLAPQAKRHRHICLAHDFDRRNNSCPARTMNTPLAQRMVEAPPPEIIARLTRALLLKSLLELLFLCLVLGVAGFKYFNPTIRGEITQADAVSVRGWVSNPLAPRDPIQLELVIDGRLTAIASAEQVWAEHATTALLRGGEAHPFTFSFPPLAAGTHSVQVYAAQTTPGRALTLFPITGRAQTFTLTPDR